MVLLILLLIATNMAVLPATSGKTPSVMSAGVKINVEPIPNPELRKPDVNPISERTITALRVITISPLTGTY